VRVTRDTDASSGVIARRQELEELAAAIASAEENIKGLLYEYYTPEEIVKMLLQHDVIDFIVGTRINWAHQDPEQPLELELRKYVIKRIVKILQRKFFKKVMVEYI
jgi:hypothetical protein